MIDTKRYDEFISTHDIIEKKTTKKFKRYIYTLGYFDGIYGEKEYERYILRDKAFVRRFQKVEVLEPTREENIEILIGTLPKIEKRTGAKMKYTPFIQKKMMEFITDITSEYKRIYEIGSRYPDVSLTIVQEAFSNALFDNRFEVNVIDFKKAIMSSKNIYPDVITKSMPIFDTMFKDQIQEYNEETNANMERLSEDSAM